MTWPFYRSLAGIQRDEITGRYFIAIRMELTPFGRVLMELKR